MDGIQKIDQKQPKGSFQGGGLNPPDPPFPGYYINSPQISKELTSNYLRFFSSNKLTSNYFEIICLKTHLKFSVFFLKISPQFIFISSENCHSNSLIIYLSEKLTLFF